MPNYTHAPPENPTGPSLPIFRTPSHTKIRAIITSHDLIGTNTHFWGGHTVPCGTPNCEPCMKGVPYRWHAYLSAFQPPKALHFLYECTALAAEVLVAYRAKHSTLRTCIFEAYRWRNALNGRVMLRCEPIPYPHNDLPAAPDLEAVLAILWQLPKHNVKTQSPGPFGPQVAVDLAVPGVNLPIDQGEKSNDPPNPTF